MTDEYIPPNNDILMRHLIMQYYTDTVEFGGTLRIWMNSPKRTKHGNFDTKAQPYRVGFLRLFSMTKYIRSVAEAKLVTEIENWFNSPYNDTMNERQKELYFLKGLSLSDRWIKLLIQQNIIAFN